MQAALTMADPPSTRLSDHPYAALLASVEKPARYSGGEVGSALAQATSETATRMAKNQYKRFLNTGSPPMFQNGGHKKRPGQIISGINERIGL